MDININLKEWKVRQGKDAGAPVLQGEYEIQVNKKVMATQTFNGEYNGFKVPFSIDLIKQIADCEKAIVKEIHGLIV